MVRDVLFLFFVGGWGNYDEQVLQLQKLEVLARDEMLNLVADLLEGNHPELYAEFKRMVNEAVRFFSYSTARVFFFTVSRRSFASLYRAGSGGRWAGLAVECVVELIV